eukprot:scaffold44160_cov17-Tisochrysis_lutea.AAC.6
MFTCSETGWSGSHPAHAAVPDQAGRTGAPIGPALPEHDHPMFGTGVWVYGIEQRVLTPSKRDALELNNETGV